MELNLQEIWNESEKTSFLGALFSRFRQNRGLQPADVALSLKIPEQLIFLVERGEWKKLPPHPYGTGLVRSYARLLDLDLQKGLEDPEKLNAQQDQVKKETEERKAQELQNLFSTEKDISEETLIANLNELVSTSPPSVGQPQMAVSPARSQPAASPPASTSQPSSKRVETPLPALKGKSRSPTAQISSQMKQVRAFWTDLQHSFKTNLIRMLSHSRLRGVCARWSLFFLALACGILLNRYLTHETEEEVILTTPVSFQRPLAPEEELQAGLTVLKPCSLQIHLDGILWKKGVLERGTYLLKFFKNAYIFVEDGSAVELQWRGWNHGPLGNKERKRILHLVRHLD